MPSDEKKSVTGPEDDLKVLRAKLNSYSEYIPTRAVKGSSGWVHAPAYLKVLKLAEYGLMEVGVRRGMKIRQPADLMYVRAAMIEGQTVIHIYPTHAKDKDRIEVRRNSSGVWINLITLLGPEGLLVEAGYRECFVITSVGEEGPFGPAITFDMARPIDRKLKSRRKKEQGTQVAQQAAGSDENE